MNVHVCCVGRKDWLLNKTYKKNEIKDCGNHRLYNNISNKHFGKLTALYVADKQKNTKSRCKIWHCKCECGKECDVNYNDLVSGKVQSCGCLKSEKIKQLYIDGTAPCKLSGGKLRSTNTSGVTGVWFDKSKGLWVSEITFKRKKYFLGRFSDKNDAIAIRKEAEKEIFGDFLKWHKENIK